MAKECAWCHKRTNLPKIFAAQSPLLEWMEEKINNYCKSQGIRRVDLWSENSDWGRIELSESFELELITYDDLTVTVDRRHICKQCLLEDDRMDKKYYLDGVYYKEGLDDDDFEINIEDLE